LWPLSDSPRGGGGKEKREEKKREKIKMKRRNITSGGIEAALHRGRYFRGCCKEQRQLRLG